MDSVYNIMLKIDELQRTRNNNICDGLWHQTSDKCGGPMGSTREEKECLHNERDS